MEKEFVVIPDQNKKEAVELAEKVLAWLLEKNVSAALACSDSMDFPARPGKGVLFGGDGFIMRQSLRLGGLDIPFLAINLGRKGFLAVAEKENWREVLEKVIAGKYTIEKRLILAVTHQGKEITQRFEAAGDVYIRHRTNMIRFNVTINGELVYENIFGDGVIVATSTGATGYNLSAGGPIFETGMAVTPICPHAINVKSLQLDELSNIEISYLETKTHREDEGCLLFVDGVKYPIAPGDRIVVCQASKRALFVIPEGFSFFKALQRKLGLSK